MNVLTTLSRDMERELVAIVERASEVRDEAHDFVRAVAAEQDDTVIVGVSRDGDSLLQRLMGRLTEVRVQAFHLFVEGMAVLVVGHLAWTGGWIWKDPNAIEVVLGLLLVAMGGSLIGRSVGWWRSWHHVAEIVEKHSGQFIGAGEHGVYFSDRRRRVAGFVPYSLVMSISCDDRRVVLVAVDGSMLAVIDDVPSEAAERFVSWVRMRLTGKVV